MIAHGSRRETANIEFRETVSQVARDLADVYEHTEAAFLDCISPTLNEAAKALIEGGAGRIDVYPFFLNRGKHIDRDIPELVDALNRSNPACEIKLLDYLGKSVALPELVEQHIREQEDA